MCHVNKQESSFSKTYNVETAFSNVSTLESVGVGVDAKPKWREKYVFFN